MKRIIYNNYSNPAVREICHGIKENDNECINIMADYILNLNIIDCNSILIPAPQHQGYAIYTRKVADIIAEESNARVLDIIVSKPRDTLYNMKKQKIPLTLDFYLKDEIHEKGDLYFIDNVLATGQTWLTAQKLFESTLTPLVYGVGK